MLKFAFGDSVKSRKRAEGVTPPAEQAHPQQRCVKRKDRPPHRKRYPKHKDRYLTERGTPSAKIATHRKRCSPQRKSSAEDRRSLRLTVFGVIFPTPWGYISVFEIQIKFQLFSCKVLFTFRVMINSLKFNTGPSFYLVHWSIPYNCAREFLYIPWLGLYLFRSGSRYAG